MKKEVFLKKGAPIVCPICYKAVLKIARDRVEGDEIVAEDVELCEQYKGKYKQPKNGDKIKCLYCNSSFFTISRINQMEALFHFKISAD